MDARLTSELSSLPTHDFRQMQMVLYRPSPFAAAAKMATASPAPPPAASGCERSGDGSDGGDDRMSLD